MSALKKSFSSRPKLLAALQQNRIGPVLRSAIYVFEGKRCFVTAAYKYDWYK